MPITPEAYNFHATHGIRPVDADGDILDTEVFIRGTAFPTNTFFG